MVQLNITVPIDLIDQLDDYADARQISRAEALRTLLAVGLANPPAPGVPGQLEIGHKP